MVGVMPADVRRHSDMTPRYARALVVVQPSMLGEAIAQELVSQRVAGATRLADQPPQAIEAVREYRPELLILGLKVGTGLDVSLARQAREQLPQFRLVVILAEEDLLAIPALVQLNAAFVDAGHDLDAVLHASLAPGAGMLHCPGEWLPKLAQAGAALRTQQVVLLQLMAQGCSNAAIGATLAMSAKTVESHVTRLSVRLGVRTRSDAVARGRELGLLQPAQR